jgi:hypothetical protein
VTSASRPAQASLSICKPRRKKQTEANRQIDFANQATWTDYQKNVKAAPEVGAMAKGPQGLLGVGGSFRADGGAAFLRSLTSSALRFSLAICVRLAEWVPPRGRCPE